MREFLKLSATLAFAWMMASIPVWIALSIYLQEFKNQTDETLIRINELENRLDISKSNMEEFNQSISAIHKMYDKDIPELFELIRSDIGITKVELNKLNEKEEFLIEFVNELRKKRGNS